MGGKFLPLSAKSLDKKGFNSNIELPFEDVNYSRSFTLKDYRRSTYDLYFFESSSGKQYYYFQNGKELFIVSDMVDDILKEIANETVISGRQSVITKSAWGDCYKETKEKMTEMVNSDGENEAICDFMDYLGLCSAAIATAAAINCIK